MTDEANQITNTCTCTPIYLNWDVIVHRILISDHIMMTSLIFSNRMARLSIEIVFKCLVHLSNFLLRTEVHMEVLVFRMIKSDN